MQTENKNRKSIRIKGYDYSSVGDYFVTICTQNRECLFEEIIDGEMKLNEVGKIAEKCWFEIPKHFPNTELDIFQIMPNHMHFVLRILDAEDIGGNRRGAIYCAQTNNAINQGAINCAPTGGGFSGAKSPLLNPNSLSKIIRWFKGRITFEVRKSGFGFEWQRNYYEHIIRNEQSYNEIYNYIQSNPQTWDRDRNNPTNITKITS